MSNTALQQQIADEPKAVQDEVLAINTHARNLSLQVALLDSRARVTARLLNSFRMLRLPGHRAQADIEGVGLGRGVEEEARPVVRAAGRLHRSGAAVEGQGELGHGSGPAGYNVGGCVRPASPECGTISAARSHGVIAVRDDGLRNITTRKRVRLMPKQFTAKSRSTSGTPCRTGSRTSPPKRPKAPPTCSSSRGTTWATPRWTPSAARSSAPPWPASRGGA